MIHRILSGALALLLVLCLLPGAVLPASAAGEMSPSEEIIDFIKRMEGFSSTAKWDVSQWSIGYGTASTPGATITREEADTALRQSLTTVSEALNAFTSENELSLTQSQFDALVSLSFNCGTGWTKQTGRFRRAVLNGTTGNEFLFAISLWANVSSVPEPGLLKRRLCEANLYLNGEYSLTLPSGYTYVIFDANGGIPGSGSEDKMQGYDSTGATAILVEDPQKSGASFLGWFTSPVGGTQVKELTADTAEKTLFAHWSDGSAQSVIATGTVKCDTNVNVRRGAGTGYAITGRVTNGTELSFFEIKTVGNTKWGRFSSGWICLDYVTLKEQPSDSWQDGEKEENSGNQTGDNKTEDTVLGSGYVSSQTKLNVRSGAGTNYALVGSLTPGTRVSVYETKTVGGVRWGRIDETKWVCLSYVKLEQENTSGGSIDTGTETETPIETGKVSSQTRLNVRSGAGTNYTLVRTLTPGTQVSVYEIKTVGGVRWGRIDAGSWVCMNYVTPDKKDQDSAGNEKTDTDASVSTGYVSSQTRLNVRSGAGTGYQRVSTLTPGTQVTVYETVTVGGVRWGRIDTGSWVCMDYITLSTASSSTQDSLRGQVTSSDGLRIRKNPGTNQPIVGAYTRGAAVTILEQRTVGGTPWGRTDKGWICMSYVKIQQDGASAWN